jgi:hypothetical protein
LVLVFIDLIELWAQSIKLIDVFSVSRVDNMRIHIPFCGTFPAISERDFSNAQKVCQLIEDHEEAFSRHLSVGHITGSAFVVDKEARSLLMTHHAKLNKWLQLGGHCDGIKDPLFVSKKEAYEESGLKTILSTNDFIFDIDIHPIAARKNEPSHYHYDIRYLFLASQRDLVRPSEESISLKWIEFNKIDKFSDDQSIINMVRKVDDFLLIQ